MMSMTASRSGELWYHPNPTRTLDDKLSRSCIYSPQAPTSAVLYLLHGVGDNEYSWEIQGGVSSLVESLIQEGYIRPLMVTMPFGFICQQNKLNRRFPRRLEFNDYLSSFLKEVEQSYESKKKLNDEPRTRAIAGLSMGGKQALEFAFEDLEHARLFTAVGSFSAAIQDRGEGPAVDNIAERIAMAREAGVAPPLYCSCGREDKVPELANANKSLEDKLKASGIVHTFNWLSGGHEWSVWRRSLEEFLRLWIRS